MTTTTQEVSIADGMRKGDPDYCQSEHYVSWTAHIWDCPACGSLLLAIAEESLGHTRETDAVICPICGDTSVQVYASHVPEIQCLIAGDVRLPCRQAAHT
jgi:hypothetical protein